MWRNIPMIHGIDYFGFIYRWLDSSNGMFYLGSHEGSEWGTYTGSGRTFKKAYKDHPKDFSRIILQYCSVDDRDFLFFQEESWLKIIPEEEFKNYYNQSHRASGFDSETSKHNWTIPAYREAQRRRLKVLHTGAKRSLKTRERMSEAASGKKKTYIKTTETRAKLSKALTGDKNPMFGKKRSPESCAKQSKTNTGRKHSPETTAKIAKANTGKKRSPEICAMIGMFSKGRIRSIESRAKQSATILRNKQLKEAIAQVNSSRDVIVLQ
jgi:NUMOD3 motif